VKAHHRNQVFKGMTFDYDNAPSHTAKVIIAKTSELGMSRCRILHIFQILPHATSSFSAI
jgi:hypothetical protein